ncbi:hypothetical protein O181_056847 [Austropuccinia psidii MF-1]|uniref:Uncharacterized protein n=1 Tax=Austropuccinia psidii MF-1 TaxID=1389203 RepID=A0A9Q3EBK2_9BASI|nr:hypothetical protein [Austropuccinia psidii MF-1]
MIWNSETNSDPCLQLNPLTWRGLQSHFSVVTDKRTLTENTVLLSQERRDLTINGSPPQRSNSSCIALSSILVLLVVLVCFCYFRGRIAVLNSIITCYTKHCHLIGSKNSSEQPMQLFKTDAVEKGKRYGSKDKVLSNEKKNPKFKNQSC